MRAGSSATTATRSRSPTVGRDSSTCSAGPTAATSSPVRSATPIEAEWRLHRGTAIIEMARASGLVLAGGADGNDPMAATTTGVGELIDRALDGGATRIIVGLGGSATTDGGLGALRAIHAPVRLRGVELLVACDVTTLFVDAAQVFGPQKGATSAQVALLTRRLERLRSDVPGRVRGRRRDDPGERGGRRAGRRAGGARWPARTRVRAGGRRDRPRRPARRRRPRHHR